MLVTFVKRNLTCFLPPPEINPGFATVEEFLNPSLMDPALKLPQEIAKPEMFAKRLFNHVPLVGRDFRVAQSGPTCFHAGLSKTMNLISHSSE